jgi:hypothetical protein
MERRQRFMPGGVPLLVRCYDNGGSDAAGGSVDRYTVCFTGRYRSRTAGEFCYLCMSEHPFDPHGVSIHGSDGMQIDVNRWGFAPMIGRKNHLGRRIKFEDLPEDCRALVVADYCAYWDLGLPEPPKGVADPEMWTAEYLAKLRSYARQKPGRTVRAEDRGRDSRPAGPLVGT